MTKRDVLALGERMAALPPKDDGDREVGTREAVQLLRSHIRDLRKKGWSFEQIAEYMTTEGLPVKKATLESYYTRRANGKGNGSGKKEPAKSGGKPNGGSSNKRSTPTPDAPTVKPSMAVKSDPALS